MSLFYQSSNLIDLRFNLTAKGASMLNDRLAISDTIVMLREAWPRLLRRFTPRNNLFSVFIGWSCWLQQIISTLPKRVV